MCGRYTLLADELAIKEAFGLQQSLDFYEPSYNIAPGQKVLSIIHDGKERRAGYMKWGLVPSWAKDPKIGYKMINARSETVHEKPSFKRLLSSKRCLIIADSFYEWKKKLDKKQPMRIQLENKDVFAFAGLWDKWQGDEEPLFTCTILTRQANQDMQELHHRMPVILPKAREEEWIEPKSHNSVDWKYWLDYEKQDRLIHYPVSTHVNNAKNNDEKCISAIIEE
ncbi:SOS response-associated peptidase [Oceanobacillus kimchii]|uniref:SOS response-associated peptidase n=1 Tax=Oceanobacillus kimchii TaxID=746691 RepID=UPI00034CC136|nr:SOS response-associated peptidase [Oceanobacillus kimchii]